MVEGHGFRTMPRDEKIMIATMAVAGKGVDGL